MPQRGKQKREAAERKVREIQSKRKISCVISGLQHGRGREPRTQPLKPNNVLRPIVSKDIRAFVLQPHGAKFSPQLKRAWK